MNWVKEILRGIMIGIANIIPGVSGGTMAVSMGIYDKMIYAVNHLHKEFKKSILTLLPYGIGMVVGIGVLSFMLGFLFEEYPFQTSLCFIGLILGGVPAILGRIKGEQKGSVHFLIVAVFFAGIILLQVLGGGVQREAVLLPGLGTGVMLFFVGILASATMVVPGVSGSMILMLLGVYTPLLSQIRLFIESAVHFEMQPLFSSAALLVPFGLGIVLGIVLIAKLIGFLLEHFKSYTYMGILGLVFASPVVVLMQTEMGGVGIAGIAVGLLCLLLGLLAAGRMSE